MQLQHVAPQITLALLTDHSLIFVGQGRACIWHRLNYCHILSVTTRIAGYRPGLLKKKVKNTINKIFFLPLRFCFPFFRYWQSLALYFLPQIINSWIFFFVLPFKKWFGIWLLEGCGELTASGKETKRPLFSDDKGNASTISLKKSFERNVAREYKSKSIHYRIKIKLCCKSNTHFTEIEFIDE